MWSWWIKLQLLTVTFAGLLSTGQSCRNCNSDKKDPQTQVTQLLWPPITPLRTKATTSHHVISYSTESTEGVTSDVYGNTTAYMYKNTTTKTNTGTIIAIAVGVCFGLIVITMATVIIVYRLRHSASKQRQQNLHEEADKSPSKRIESNPVDESTDYYNCRSINPATPKTTETGDGQTNKARYVSSGQDVATKFNDITLVENDLYQG